MKWFEKWISRKFIAATLTALLLFVAWVLCQWLPFARDYFGTLATSLVGALAAYTGGNVLQDHVLKDSVVRVHRDDVYAAKPAPVQAIPAGPSPSQPPLEESGA